MGTPITNPTQVVNLALVKLGAPYQLGSLYDGSDFAKRALAVYSQTRDSLIENGQWEFAERNSTGVLLKQAPPRGYSPAQPWSTAFPPIPWLYEYAYPDDCVKFRSIRFPPFGLFNPDPQFRRYSLDNDNSFNPPVRVILCNVPNAVITYAGRVTDPSTWDAAFVDAVVDELCEALAPASPAAALKAENDRRKAEMEMK